MWSKLSKNGIIEGPVKSLCLVCESQIENGNKIQLHIEDTYHEKRLALFPYLEKYSRDHIRKIKGLYLCEYCSVVINTATMVNTHIATKDHCNARDLHQLRNGPKNGIIAFEKVLIPENAWHSIDENCCSLCGIEDDVSNHKQSVQHLMKLVQSKIEFVDNGLYRKIDENTAQCLTCNTMFGQEMVSLHYDSDAHKKLFTKSQIQQITNGESPKSINTEIKQDSCNSNAFKSKDKPKENMLDTKEMQKICKENKIIFNVGHEYAYCTTCEIRIPASLLFLKEHLMGTHHRSKQIKLKKQPMNDFTKKVTTIENIFHKDIVINNKLCISYLSAHLITNNKRMYCEYCEQDFYEGDLKKHTDSSRHALDNISVIINYDSEFLREIRRGIFHCGFCNVVIKTLEEIPSHFESSDHKRQKGLCQERLERYLPQIKENDEQDMNKLKALMNNLQQ